MKSIPQPLSLSLSRGAQLLLLRVFLTAMGVQMRLVNG